MSEENKVKKGTFRDVTLTKDKDGHVVSANKIAPGTNAYDPETVTPVKHNFDRDNYEEALEKYMEYHGTHKYMKRTLEDIPSKQTK